MAMKETLTPEMDFAADIKIGAPVVGLKKLSLYPRTGQVNVFGNQTVEIVIPASSKGHYFQNDQSYLQFRINNTSAVPIILDASAFSVWNKAEVFFGGTRLSSVNNIGMFGNMLLDHNVSADDRSTVWNAAGTAIPNYTSGTASATTLQADQQVGVFSRRGHQIGAGGFLDVAIPIPAGILSPQGSEKSWPMSQLKDDLIIALTTAPISRWFRIASGTLTAANADAQIYLSKIVYQCSMLQVTGAVDEMIYKSLPNETFTIPCSDVMNYTQSISAGTGAIINIPARLKSVKQIFCVFSRLFSNTTVHVTVPSVAATAVLNDAVQAPFNSSGIQGASSSFVNGDGFFVSSNGAVSGGITGWRLRVGGENYGICQDPRAEGRQELQKAFHKINSANACSSVTEKQYLDEAFVIGMSLEAYGADQSYYDGLEFSNAGSVQLEVDGTFPACTACVWIVYDKVFKIQDGLITYKE